MINQSEVTHGASVEVVAGHRLSCVGLRVQIVDSPRFDWRGALLDVGRHYFSVPFIYKFLDVCAFYKINKFHWHLTEDQVCMPAAHPPVLEHHLGLPLQMQCSYGSWSRRGTAV